MMGRLKSDQGQLFYEFHLGDAVPEDHLVRKIDAALDLSWLRSELAPHYSSMGRPSIDPELMIRMLVVGYVFAIRSERLMSDGLSLGDRGLPLPCRGFAAARAARGKGFRSRCGRCGLAGLPAADRNCNSGPPGLTTLSPALSQWRDYCSVFRDPSVRRVRTAEIAHINAGAVARSSGHGLTSQRRIKRTS